jgi:ubiquinone biosynthesis protein Coq4
MLFKGKTAFDFTDEWQYLSTDLFLFNADEFGSLINELIEDKRRHRKSDEYLEYLCITATLRDMKFFDKQEIVYPIYNFSIDRDRSKNYSTRITRSRDVVRLIDNLPISSTNDVVEAEIEAKAIANHQRPVLYQLVSTQLLNIAKIANPTEAVMALVGEFGNFLQSSSDAEPEKQHYEFSSTIRLYEGENFNQRLYSVRVYAFLPPGVNQRFDDRRLKEVLAQNIDLQLDRKQLKELARFNGYPFMVIANYRSAYQMPVVVGDEVNREMIKKRREQVARDYELELINEATYTQELKFISFLEEFAGLKKAIEAYTLAYELGNTDDISQSLFSIIQQYHQLRQVLKSRDQEFAEDPSYQNIFREKYQDILRNGELYLDKDFNLKNCKRLVSTLFELERGSARRMDSLAREQTLNALHAVKLPALKFLQQTVVGQEILRRVKSLEEVHFLRAFQPDCQQLDMLPANDNTLTRRNALRRRASQTNCQACKDRVETHLQRFNERYAQYQLQQLQSKKSDMLAMADDQVFEFLRRKDCIQAQIDSLDAASIPSYQQRLIERFEATNGELKQLDQHLSGADLVSRENKEELLRYLDRLQSLLEGVGQGYGYICEKMPQMCDCGR